MYINDVYHYFSAALVTLRDHGATLTPAGGVVNTHELHGYLVGGVVPSGIIGRTDNHVIIANALRNFVAQHAATFQADPSLYLGTWVNDDNVHIDAVEFIGNRTAALETARERGELAIWDCQHGNEVGVEYAGPCFNDAGGYENA